MTFLYIKCVRAVCFGEWKACSVPHFQFNKYSIMAKKEEIKKKKIESTIVDNVPTDAVEIFKQPWNLTVLKGEMTRSQVNMLIELVGQLQGRIREAQRDQRTSLFSNEDFGEEGKISIDIPLSSITKNACKYGEIETIATRLLDMKIVTEKEEEGRMYQVWENIFDSVWIPKDEAHSFKSGVRRKGFIRIVFSREKSNKVFSLDRYTRYIKGVAKNSKSLFTSRLYMMLSANKDFGQWIVTYDELHRIFGFSSYDINKGEWVVVKYPEYRKFKQRVLSPACEELKSLAEQGETDLYFDFAEIYPAGRSSGQPEKIRFSIHTTGYGKSQEVLSDYQRKKIELERNCREWFDFRTSDCNQLLHLVNADNIDFTLLKANDVKDYLEKNSSRIEKKCSYAISVLKSALLDLVPMAEEVTDSSSEKVLRPSSPVMTEQSLRDKWISAVGIKDYKMYLSQVRIDLSSGKVIVYLPHTDLLPFVNERKELLGISELIIDN